MLLQSSESCPLHIVQQTFMYFLVKFWKLGTFSFKPHTVRTNAVLCHFLILVLFLQAFLLLDLCRIAVYLRCVHIKCVKAYNSRLVECVLVHR